MPRLINRNPRYRKHRASGQALVTLNGQDHYLGKYGTKASRTEYDRLIAQWLANGRRLPCDPADLFIAELIEAFWTHAEAYYGGHSHRGELGNYRLLLAILNRLYGSTTIAAFGTAALRTCRQAMIEAGWARNYINRQIVRLRHVFKWGIENDLVPVDVHARLTAVGGLKRGKSQAKESEPVRPVPEQHVHAIKEHVSRQVWAMIELQMLTGMRPGEVCAMRGCDLDTTGTLWTYKPAKHKTQHHGHERTVYLGPKAQAVLRPWLRADLQAHLFQSAEAEAERREKLRQQRKTPATCGNRAGTNRTRSPRHKPLDHYTTNSYRRAIDYGCDDAFPPPPPLARQRVQAAGRKRNATRWESPAEWKQRLGKDGWAQRRKWVADHRWHPNQLRHNAATKLRQEYGLEAAQVILGHQTLTVTQVYAEKNVAAAMKIMGEVG